jgi:hypothetical protein
VAGNGESASRREFVSAVVAIVVGGVVGLAGVVVGCQSSRDAQRTARQAQLETTQVQREQADLAELRGVLDRAMAELQRFDLATDELIQTGQALQTGSARFSDVRRKRNRRHPVALAVYGSQARLTLRLGKQAAVVRYFTEATNLFDAASVSFDTEVWARGQKAGDRFTEKAHELVGSQLPDR